MSEQKISELFIYKDGKTIFDENEYIIPLYQRAFAWEEEEIRQLIDDINGFDTKTAHYYLGSLIVKKRPDGKYEVIDGQQRLTALYLLLQHLGKDPQANSLSYECRENSNYTLNNLNTLIDDENEEKSTDDYKKRESSLIYGTDHIKSTFRNEGIQKDEFLDKLEKVKIYRIEVPEHTDLNRYFEIMNVRGEQLEQHDILKAKLIAMLDKSENTDRIACSQFALVWDACADMNGYVQMHFATNNRRTLFGWEWRSVPDFKPGSAELAIEEEENENAVSMREIINGTLEKGKERANKDNKDEDDSKSRFKSIISFPHFLLHVLKVYVQEKLDNAKAVLFDQLDDKKLVEYFDNVIKNGEKNGEKIKEEDFAKDFIWYLLRCRFLFDKYIIKREYKKDMQENENGNDDGEWSLKELRFTGKRGEYNTTRLKKNEQKIDNRAKKVLMLLSCLRVSYTSPKSMHWITDLLSWLNKHTNYDNLTDYEAKAEKIAKEPIVKFLNDKNFYLGVGTPHIVFNFLDYLLWTKRDCDKDYKRYNFENFVFEFRNSVEHWYPQHPSSNSFDAWDDRVADGVLERDYFGNLCIISREVNSRFSNFIPTSKKSNYPDRIKNASLKLRIMSEITVDDAEWRKTVYKDHGEKMLKLLCDACGIDYQNIPFLV